MVNSAIIQQVLKMCFVRMTTRLRQVIQQYVPEYKESDSNIESLKFTVTRDALVSGDVNYEMAIDVTWRRDIKSVVRYQGSLTFSEHEFIDRWVPAIHDMLWHFDAENLWMTPHVSSSFTREWSLTSASSFAVSEINLELSPDAFFFDLTKCGSMQFGTPSTNPCAAAKLPTYTPPQPQSYGFMQMPADALDLTQPEKK